MKNCSCLLYVLTPDPIERAESAKILLVLYEATTRISHELTKILLSAWCLLSAQRCIQLALRISWTTYNFSKTIQITSFPSNTHTHTRTFSVFLFFENITFVYVTLRLCCWVSHFCELITSYEDAFHQALQKDHPEAFATRRHIHTHIHTPSLSHIRQRPHFEFYEHFTCQR